MLSSMGTCIKLLGVAATAHAATFCRATPVDVRLPRSLSTSASNWRAPPVGWDFGNWFQTNSSNPSTSQRNLQYSTLPIDATIPYGQRTDLFSFQLNNGNDTILTVYGTDTPTPHPAVYFYQGTGILQNANDSLQILAWGYDCRGYGYRVSYSTATEFTQSPASLDILSRQHTGPDAITLNKIQRALLSLENDNLSILIRAIVPTVQDDGRDGMAPILECDSQCQTNDDVLSLLG